MATFIAYFTNNQTKFIGHNFIVYIRYAKNINLAVTAKKYLNSPKPSEFVILWFYGQRHNLHAITLIISLSLVITIMKISSII